MIDTSHPPTLPEQREAIRFIRHCTDLELDYARIGIRTPNGTCPTRTDLVNALTGGHLDGRILLSNVHVCPRRPSVGHRRTTRTDPPRMTHPF